MQEIFTWGFEHPNKNDYTKNKAAISNKIRKMQTALISEAHDNFRRPQTVAEEDQLIFNYFDAESIEKFKRLLWETVLNEEREGRNRSMFKEQFGESHFDKNHNLTMEGAKFEKQKEEISKWTVAGKSSIACNNKKIHNFGKEMTMPTNLFQ